jgi:hypothetical protein
MFIPVSITVAVVRTHSTSFHDRVTANEEQEVILIEYNMNAVEEPVVVVDPSQRHWEIGCD